MRLFFLSLATFSTFTLPLHAQTGDSIQIVGSSTVYPFVTVVAEEFGNVTDFRTPIVESTGTGGGFKLFCAGIGENYPDVVNASRTIKHSEAEMCAKNGVEKITEIKIGFDGIVLANSKEEERFSLSKSLLFLALAKTIPVEGQLVVNPHKKWSDVDPSLPEIKIEVYGPPTTSGTRDAFVELVMEPSCKDLPAFKEAYPDKKARKKMCHLLREDGRYIEVGENDNLIVQKLRSNPKALGLFGFSFLEQNTDTIQGSLIENKAPNFENISDGSYSVSRSLYVYVKESHIGKTAGLGEFIEMLVSEDAAGEYGYLGEKGLIPLPVDELKSMQERSNTLTQ